eukprot:gene41711-56471_t
MTAFAPGIDDVRARTFPFPRRHFLSAMDVNVVEAQQLLDLADGFVALNRQTTKKLDLLKGRTLMNLFFENSTRTQASFELAGKRLGADVMNMSVKTSSVAKGETLIDTAVTLNAMQPDLLVVRHASSGAATSGRASSTARKTASSSKARCRATPMGRSPCMAAPISSSAATRCGTVHRADMMRKSWTPAVAALLNGALGHSLDFDDTHADSSLHPSAPVVPAAFAVVCCRLGNALDPTSHYARGFHPTATAGTYGAAAAAAKLFGLSKEQIISAFGVSGSQAAGSLQFLVNGAWNKRYQVGASAMNGVIAATLARNDFVGATESVEGKHGLLVGYSDNAHPDKATAGLGTVYETMKIGVK